MKRPAKFSLNEIKNDLSLRPFFIEYIAENLKMTMAMSYELDAKEKTRFKSNAAKSLLELIKQLEGKVSEDRIHPTIENVCQYYLQFVNLLGGSNLKIKD